MSGTTVVYVLISVNKVVVHTISRWCCIDGRTVLCIITTCKRIPHSHVIIFNIQRICLWVRSWNIQLRCQCEWEQCYNTLIVLTRFISTILCILLCRKASCIVPISCDCPAQIGIPIRNCIWIIITTDIYRICICHGCQIFAWRWSKHFFHIWKPACIPTFIFRCRQIRHKVLVTILCSCILHIILTCICCHRIIKVIPIHTKVWTKCCCQCRSTLIRELCQCIMEQQELSIIFDVRLQICKCNRTCNIISTEIFRWSKNNCTVWFL